MQSTNIVLNKLLKIAGYTRKYLLWAINCTKQLADKSLRKIYQTNLSDDTNAKFY